MKKILLAAAAVTVLVPAAPALAFDWNGFYAGVSAGYATVDSDASYDEPMYSTASLDSNPTGWLAGAQAGANMSMSGVVVGFEGDISLADITDTIYDQAADDQARPGNWITSTTDWTGTVRGRVGFDAGEFMPYLTAGLAFSHVVVDATDGPLSTDATLWGWTVGLGAEAAVADNVTVKGEYLYTDLGEHTWFDGEVWSSTSSSTSHTVRGGVNFHFD